MRWSCEAVKYGKPDSRMCGQGAMEVPRIGPDKPFLRAAFVGLTRFDGHLI